MTELLPFLFLEEDKNLRETSCFLRIAGRMERAAR